MPNGMGKRPSWRETRQLRQRSRPFLSKARLAAGLLITSFLVSSCTTTIARPTYTPTTSPTFLNLPAGADVELFVPDVADRRGVNPRLVFEASGSSLVMDTPLAFSVKEALIQELFRLGIGVASSPARAKGRLEAEITQFLGKGGTFSGQEFKATIGVKVSLYGTGLSDPAWEASLEGHGAKRVGFPNNLPQVAPISMSKTLSDAIGKLGRERGFAEALAQLAPAPPAVAKAPPPAPAPGPRAAVPSSIPPDREELRSAGSGFLLQGTSHILTNFHVLQGVEDIRVSFPSGEVYTGKVVATDANNDLALVLLQGMPPKRGGFVPNLFGTEIRPGQQVHALGYPLGPSLSRQPSIVSGQVSSTTGLQDNIAQFRMTAPINEGNSGGPVIDSHGKLIGIASSGLIQRGVEAIRFGTKISAASLLLDQAQLAQKFSITVTPRETPMRPEEIFSEFSPYVVLIETR